MNNSKIVNESNTLQEEIEVDRKPYIRERMSELTANLNAIDGLLKNDDWKLLEEKVFKPAVDKLEKDIIAEAKKSSIDTAKIHQLQGSIAWAKIYSDISKFGERLKSELIALRKQLKKYEKSDYGESKSSRN